MPRSPSAEHNTHFIASVVAGFAGGLVASFAMGQFQTALARLASNNGGASGDEPSTHKAADAVAVSVTGKPVPSRYKSAAGAAVHYALGAGVGAIYGAASARNRGVTAWAGLPFGATVWLVADEIGVPAAGLSKGPRAYPLKTHASALASHLVYGATTEIVRRGLVRALRTPRPY